MSIAQSLFTLFWTVAFCLGLHIVTQPGQLLYFLRKPFDDAGEVSDQYEDRIKLLLSHGSEYDRDLIKTLQRKLTANLILYYIGKPLVWCITCYGSVWGSATFITLNGWHTELIPYLILNCFGSAFINTFIWNLHVKNRL